MLDAALKFILPHLQEAILLLVAGLVVFALRQLRQLLLVLRDAARGFAEKAKKTPGIVDDTVAALLVAFADALSDAFARHLPTPEQKRAPGRGPQP